ncbi:hypothetical protein JN531_003905 [Flagellatimonas centrodinii]|uniref:hypothetical protein n=1 Tax=Flagellatimonas centrodinii TaxID=2806210 RepID=UPI001FF045EF|nr:hypothetical protein [Flagellatimonas centrodinii]ULQ47431.1 hypothetical protein JN531_003905 [Flagellatimonas centrodinii]
MSDIPKTDFADLVGDLNGGVLEEQLNRALSDVAANVCTTGQRGEVVLTMKLKQIDDSSQVSLSHKLKYVLPKPRGKLMEEHESATPLHVGRGGKLTIYPNAQTRMDMGAGAATGRTDGVRESVDRTTGEITSHK